MNIDFGNVFEDEDFQEEKKVIKYEYKFNPVNEYQGRDNLMEMAEQMNKDLDLVEAVSVLEAEVQQNPKNCKAWRLLGTLHQENDEDQKAIYCFHKAYELDPFDLDSLLCLGISCTNEIRAEEAMKHLENWLRYNPNYSDLHYPNYELTDIDDQRQWLNKLFLDALHKNP